MGYVLTALLMLGFLLLFAFAFLKATPKAIASTLKMIGPLIAVLAGLTLSAVGRFGYGVPLLLLGMLWWYHNRRRIKFEKRIGTSVFRTAWLEILLNQKSDQMDGLILTGSREGKILSAMTEKELLGFRSELQDDAESLALMESYLDSQIPVWRENTDAGIDDRQGSSASTGAMTEQEAYQILGLEPGAGTQDIVACHRRLMAIVDSEKGTFRYFINRIDEARDTLVN